MIYFNGFSLEGEEVLFEDYIKKGDTCVVGFSYGAQKAFDYVYHSKERIDRLTLLSPAFFQTQKSSFSRTQLHYFSSDKVGYVQQFLANVTYPSSQLLEPYLTVGTKEELQSLLNYTWDKRKIEEVLQRGTHIELFLGTDDKIVNTQDVLTFFSMTTNYLLQGAGHLLQEL